MSNPTSSETSPDSARRMRPRKPRFRAPGYVTGAASGYARLAARLGCSERFARDRVARSVADLVAFVEEFRAVGQVEAIVARLRPLDDEIARSVVTDGADVHAAADRADATEDLVQAGYDAEVRATGRASAATARALLRARATEDLLHHADNRAVALAAGLTP